MEGFKKSDNSDEKEVNQMNSLTGKLCVGLVCLFCSVLTPNITLSAEKEVDVTIGALVNLTGHEAGQQIGIEQGIVDALAWANRHDYVPGVNLVIDWVDSGSSQSKGIEGYIKVTKSRRKPLCWIGMNTGIAEALVTRTAGDKMPHIEGGISRKLISPPQWTFCLLQPFDEQAAAAINWFLESWKKPTPPSMAILTWDNAYGRAHYTPQLEKYAKSKGIKIVTQQYVPTSPVEVKSQLIAIRDSGADFTFGGMYAGPWAVVLKDANSLGLSGKIQFISSWATNSVEVLNLTGKLSENFAITISLAEPEEWKGKIVEQIFNEANRGEASKLNMYSLGVQSVAVACEAIKRAVTKVGAKDVDQQAVYDALQTIDNFDPWGASPPVTYTKTKRYGLDQVKILRIENGKRIIPDQYISAPKLED